VAVLFGLIFTFTDMTVVYILTAGGPFDSTQTLPSLAFAMGIQGSDLAAGRRDLALPCAFAGDPCLFSCCASLIALR